MKSITQKLLLALLLLSSVSCTKSYIDINNIIGTPSDSNQNNSGNTSGNKLYSVKFNADVNPVRTKATTPIQRDRYVNIYAYKYQASFISYLTYESASQGVLNPLRGTPFLLPQGAYEFYAFGIANSAKTPPVFTDTETGMLSNAGLSNGVDYIASSLADTINSNSEIDLTFNHICAQIIVEITTGNSNLKIDTISSATISQPTTTNNLVTLFTGKISSSTSLQTTPIAMNVNNTTCNQIILPLKYNGNLTMTMGVKFEGDTNNTYNYTMPIPVVNGAYTAGSSYVFKVIINTTSANVINASINDWTDVDETGTPITPTIN